eukprot:TRINITY_DN14010_c0_g3_i1.p1 TRINITY_DN14010_c0_g3~~TRINITY_DN14010_c0_g3_i1.p1  ORF type:complete len:1021 (-),score=208.30 TRINITY_DN14010_c0_g3_i1:52-3114(-)
MDSMEVGARPVGDAPLENWPAVAGLSGGPRGRSHAKKFEMLGLSCVGPVLSSSQSTREPSSDSSFISPSGSSVCSPGLFDRRRRPATASRVTNQRDAAEGFSWSSFNDGNASEPSVVEEAPTFSPNRTATSTGTDIFCGGGSATIAAVTPSVDLLAHNPRPPTTPRPPPRPASGAVVSRMGLHGRAVNTQMESEPSCTFREAAASDMVSVLKSALLTDPSAAQGPLLRSASIESVGTLSTLPPSSSSSSPSGSTLCSQAPWSTLSSSSSSWGSQTLPVAAGPPKTLMPVEISPPARPPGCVRGRRLPTGRCLPKTPPRPKASTTTAAAAEVGAAAAGRGRTATHSPLVGSAPNAPASGGDCFDTKGHGTNDAPASVAMEEPWAAAMASVARVAAAAAAERREKGWDERAVGVAPSSRPSSSLGISPAESQRCEVKAQRPSTAPSKAETTAAVASIASFAPTAPTAVPAVKVPAGAARNEEERISECVSRRGETHRCVTPSAVAVAAATVTAAAAATTSAAATATASASPLAQEGELLRRVAASQAAVALQSTDQKALVQEQVRRRIAEAIAEAEEERLRQDKLRSHTAETAAATAEEQADAEAQRLRRSAESAVAVAEAKQEQFRRYEAMAAAAAADVAEADLHHQRRVQQLQQQLEGQQQQQQQHHQQHKHQHQYQHHQHQHQEQCDDAAAIAAAETEVEERVWREYVAAGSSTAAAEWEKDSPRLLRAQAGLAELYRHTGTGSGSPPPARRAPSVQPTRDDAKDCVAELWQSVAELQRESLMCDIEVPPARSRSLQRGTDALLEQKDATSTAAKARTAGGALSSEVEYEFDGDYESLFPARRTGGRNWRGVDRNADSEKPRTSPRSAGEIRKDIVPRRWGARTTEHPHVPYSEGPARGLELGCESGLGTQYSRCGEAHYRARHPERGEFEGQLLPSQNPLVPGTVVAPPAATEGLAAARDVTTCNHWPSGRAMQATDLPPLPGADFGKADGLGLSLSSPAKSVLPSWTKQSLANGRSR